MCRVGVSDPLGGPGLRLRNKGKSQGRGTACPPAEVPDSKILRYTTEVRSGEPPDCSCSQQGERDRCGGPCGAGIPYEFEMCVLPPSSEQRLPEEDVAAPQM